MAILARMERLTKSDFVIEKIRFILSIPTHHIMVLDNV